MERQMAAPLRLLRTVVQVTSERGHSLFILKGKRMLMRKGRGLRFLNSHTSKHGRREVLAMNFLPVLIVFLSSDGRTHRAKIFVLVMLALLLLSACERKTTVRVTGGNPPTFVISGSGELGEVIITKPKEEQTKIPDQNNVLWKITAIRMPGSPVEVVGSVTYGVTPPGYRQSLPEQGPAPTLQDNKRYGYFFVTGDAPHGTGHFGIENGQAVSIK